MMAFTKVAVLFGMALCLASAGPVERSGDDICAATCSPNEKLNFVPGRSYVYKYETKTDSALEQTSDEKSSIYMNADVVLHVVDKCRFALEVRDATLEEEGLGQSRRASSGSEELKASLMRSPLMFTYEDGHVSRICPSTEESVSGLNLKKGIISMIQNSMDRLDTDEVIEETDVTGECRTMYTAPKGWSNQVISKRKMLSKCRNHGSQQTALLAMAKNVARSSSMVNGTQECQQTIKDKIIESVECTERHVVRPFSRQEKGAATSIVQKLKLQTTGQANQRISYQQAKEQTLAFDRRHELSKNQQEAMKLAQEKIDSVVRAIETATEDAPTQFSELVRELRKMEHASLKNVYQWAAQRGEKSMWTMLDALMNANTKESIRLTSEFVADGTIGQENAKEWLLKVAMIQDFDIEVLRHLMPILRTGHIEAYLAISTVARRFCEEHRCDNNEHIIALLNKFYTEAETQCRGNSNTAIGALKALGNMGMSFGRQDVLLGCARNKALKTEVRVAAVEAFRRFTCSVDRRGLLAIFEDHTDDGEVRMGSYLNAIRCPTTEMIETIKSVLLRENQEEQVGSFIFTHLKNLAKRTTWTHNVTPVTGNTKLQHFDLDGKKFSRNYFFEMFFDPIDAGFELEGDIIFSKNVPLPRRLSLNTTVDMFGHNVNLFDFGLRFENVEDVIAFLKNEKVQPKAAVSTYIRIFGNEIFYTSTGMPKELNQLQQVIKAVTDVEGLKLTRSMMILDTEVIIPTGTGLPLYLAVNGTTTVSMEIKAKPQWQASDFTLDVHVAPKTAVEFGISMTVRAPKTRSGIHMTATASSHWALDGQMVSNKNTLQANIGVPREQSNLINVRSKVYLVGGDRRQELESRQARKQEVSMCTGEKTHLLFGHKICLDASYPSTSEDKAPMFFLRGSSHMNLRMLKTDNSLNKFHVEMSTIHREQALDRIVIRVDTPESKVDRQLKAEIYHDLSKQTFGMYLISPLKKAELEGSYRKDGESKKIHMDIKVDGQQKLKVNGELQQQAGKSNSYRPSLEVVLGNGKQLLYIGSEVSFQGTQQMAGRVEVKSMYTSSIEIKADYGIAGRNKKRASLAVASEILDAELASTLSYGDRNLAVNAAGKYSLRKGESQSFKYNMKFINAENNLVAEAAFAKNGVEIISGTGRYLREDVHSADAKVVYYGTEYSAKVSHQKKDQENELSAVAQIADKRYGSQLRYALGGKSKAHLKIQLPNGVERQARAVFMRNDAGLRLSGNSDLMGKEYSADVEYKFTDGLYKMEGEVKADKKQFQLSASLNKDPQIIAKIEFNEDGAKIASGTLGFGKDIYHPTAQVQATYKKQVLLDASISGELVKNEKVTLVISSRAPKYVNALLSMKRYGSMHDALKVESSFGLKTESYNVEATSTLDLATAGRSKNVELKGHLILPAGRYEAGFKHNLDVNSWNVEWDLKTPDDSHKMVTSGTYDIDMQSFTKANLKGKFELDTKINGHRLVIEPVNFEINNKISRREMNLQIGVEKSGKTILTFFTWAVHNDAKTGAAAGLKIWGEDYQGEWSLSKIPDGLDGLLVAKWNQKEIQAKGQLRVKPTMLAKLEVQTPFRVIPKGKLQLQYETQTTRDVITGEAMLAEQFVQGEIVVKGRSLEASAKSSFRNYETISAAAKWEFEPRVTVQLEFSMPRYEKNVASFELDQRNQYMLKGRVNMPALHRDDIVAIAGEMKTANGMNGLLRVNYRGQEKMRVAFNGAATRDSAKMSVAITEGLTGPKNIYLVDVDGKKLPQGLEYSLQIKKNSMEIVHIQHTASYDDFVNWMHQLEAKTSVIRQWNGIWLKNRLAIDRRAIKVQQELGRSRSEILGSVELSASDAKQRANHQMEGTFKAQIFEKFIGVTADLQMSEKLHKFSTSVESERGYLLRTQMEMTQDRQHQLTGKIDLPTLKKEYGLKMKMEHRRGQVLAFEATLERDNKTSKTITLSVRLPYGGEQKDGHMKIQLPEELRGQSLQLTYSLKNGMLDAAIKSTLLNQKFDAKTNMKWQGRYGFTAELNQEGKNIVNLRATMEKRNERSYATDGRIVVLGREYEGKLDGDFQSRNGQFELELQSNQWSKKQTVNGAFSADKKQASLKMDVHKLRLTAEGEMGKDYKLQIDGSFDQSKAGAEISFLPSEKRGTLTAELNGEKYAAQITYEPTNGSLKIQVPRYHAEAKWTIHLVQKTANIEGSIRAGDDVYSYVAEATWGDKVQGQITLSKNNVRYAQIQGGWEVNNMNKKIHVELTDARGEKHTFEVSFTKTEGGISGDFKLRCPWLQGQNTQTIVAHFEIQRTGTYTYNGDVRVTFNGKTHNFRVNGGWENNKIEFTAEFGEYFTATFNGEYFTGRSLNVVSNGKVYGGFNWDAKFNVDTHKIYLDINSSRLQRPITVSGNVHVANDGELGFKATAQGLPYISQPTVELEGQLYYRRQYGGFVQAAGNRQYHIKAIVEPYTSIVVDINVPHFENTSFVLTHKTGDEIAFIGKYRNKVVIDGKWESPRNNRLIGNLNVLVDIPEFGGRHTFTAVYDLVKEHKVLVKFDDHVVIDFVVKDMRGKRIASAKIPSTGAEIEAVFAMYGDKIEIQSVVATMQQVSFQLTHKNGNGGFQQKMKLSWGQQKEQTLGYELIHSNERQRLTSLQVDFPQRSFMLVAEHTMTQDTLKLTGKFFWDFTRDQNKRFEAVFAQTEVDNGQLISKIIESSLSAPFAGKKLAHKTVIEAHQDKLHLNTEIKLNDDDMRRFISEVTVIFRNTREEKRYETHVSAKYPATGLDMQGAWYFHDSPKALEVEMKMKGPSGRLYEIRAELDKIRKAIKSHVKNSEKTIEHMGSYINNEDRFELRLQRVDQRGDEIVAAVDKRFPSFTVQLGKLIQAHGKINKWAIELFVAHERSGAQVTDIDIALKVADRKTLKARAHWRSQLLRSALESAMDAPAMLQRRMRSVEGFDRVAEAMKKESTQVANDWQKVGQEVGKDLRKMREETRGWTNQMWEQYQHDALHLRSAVERVQETLKPMQRYLDQVDSSLRRAARATRETAQSFADKSQQIVEKMSEIYSRATRAVSQQTEEMRQYGAEMGEKIWARSEEVLQMAEDKAKDLAQILDRATEKTYFRKAVRYMAGYIEKNSPMLKRIVKERMCTIAKDESDLRRNQCGLAYSVNSGAVDIMMRAPVVIY